MTTREARKIANLIQRQSYLENYEQLQYLCLDLDLEIDFDAIYFSDSLMLEIAAIYGLSIDERNLYILTKNNILFLI